LYLGRRFAQKIQKKEEKNVSRRGVDEKH